MTEILKTFEKCLRATLEARPELQLNTVNRTDSEFDRAIKLSRFFSKSPFGCQNETVKRMVKCYLGYGFEDKITGGSARRDVQPFQAGIILPEDCMVVYLRGENALPGRTYRWGQKTTETGKVGVYGKITTNTDYQPSPRGSYGYRGLWVWGNRNWDRCHPKYFRPATLPEIMEFFGIDPHEALPIVEKIIEERKSS